MTRPHLVWLRDQLGGSFVLGILFDTGPRPFQLDERVLALGAMWSVA